MASLTNFLTNQEISMDLPARTRAVSPHALLNRKGIPAKISQAVGCYDSTDGFTAEEIAALTEALQDPDLPPATEKAYATQLEVQALLYGRPTDDLVPSGRISHVLLAKLMRGERIKYTYLIAVKSYLLDNPRPTQPTPPAPTLLQLRDQITDALSVLGTALSATDTMLAHNKETK